MAALPGPLSIPGWQLILNSSQVLESTVNGQWFEALRQYFPPPDFIICPERRDAANGRADMVVLQIRPNAAGNGMQGRKVLAFEGKKGANNPPVSEQAFFNNIQQLALYMTTVTRLGQYWYGFLAAGAQAVLFARHQNDAADNVKEVRYMNGGVLQYGQVNKSLTVRDPFDAQELRRLLQAVAAAATDRNNQDNGWENLY